MNREEWEAWIADATTWKEMLKFGAAMVTMCVLIVVGVYGAAFLLMWVNSL